MLGVTGAASVSQRPPASATGHTSCWRASSSTGAACRRVRQHGIDRIAREAGRGALRAELGPVGAADAGQPRIGGRPGALRRRAASLPSARRPSSDRRGCSRRRADAPDRAPRRRRATARGSTTPARCETDVAAVRPRQRGLQHARAVHVPERRREAARAAASLPPVRAERQRGQRGRHVGNRAQARRAARARARRRPRPGPRTAPGCETSQQAHRSSARDRSRRASRPPCRPGCAAARRPRRAFAAPTC